MNEDGSTQIRAIVRRFLSGHAAMLLILFSLAVGTASIFLTPREEEPQIVVPMADILVRYPGASAGEIENLVATKLEKLLWQIDGVEYVYSMSRKDFALVTVRFFVKEDRERSLIKLYNKIQSNIDDAVPGISDWIVKPVEIDDVPILTFHLHSNDYSSVDLRRMASESALSIAQIEDISGVELFGGEAREIRVELDPIRLANKNLSALEVVEKLRKADAALNAGSLETDNLSFQLRSGPFFQKRVEVESLAIAVRDQKLVRLRDVAKVSDTYREPASYTRIGFGPSYQPSFPAKRSESGWLGHQAVGVAVSKKKGTNAVRVASNVLSKIEELRKHTLPSNLEVTITRNYGRTADDKVEDLLTSLLLAVLGVVLLVAVTLGWREAVIVALAVPISFSLSLLVNYISGYTINRVTLFALILSLGLVVDDPITNVDNIQRHIRQRLKNPFQATLDAVSEVLPPVIMLTLAIIVSFLPMFFITGMMGPYMGPMAINVPLTVTFSTFCAITIVPWAAYHLLRNSTLPENHDQKSSFLVQTLFRKFLSGILQSKMRRRLVLITTVVLLGVCGGMIFLRMVPLKMLPFDNKNEFQIVLDLPEGSSLQHTDGVVRKLERFLSEVEEVVNYHSYVGIASPMDFNGLVRHYYLRKGTHLAEIRVNLKDKDLRANPSHEIVLRLRADLTQIAHENSASIKIVEVPPGPPVLSTVVAEVYGNEQAVFEDLYHAAKTVEQKMRETQGFVDVDTSLESSHDELIFETNREKAALHGVSTRDINQTLLLALKGLEPASIHLPHERDLVAIRCVATESAHSRTSRLANLSVRSESGGLVSIGEIGRFLRNKADQPIFHKNLRRVVYITAEVAGSPPAEGILDLIAYFQENPLSEKVNLEWAGEGEWKITLDVFRDLGLAFGAALVGIYILIVLETSSLLLPLLIMLAIPLTAIGIIPGFYFLNLLVNQPVGGFETPVFFTATGMIGMIALGGIVVRNSIVLIEFIRTGLAKGMELKEAILQSGVVRFRPILLTAATTALGAVPIIFDPIFSGLAWSLIFGLIASTLFTLIIVPTVYFMVFGSESDLKEIKDQG